MPFQNELLEQFGQGVADIEGERARKKRDTLTPTATPETKPPEAESTDWIGEGFASGTGEIERSRTKETSFLPAVGRAAATVPFHIGARTAGFAEYGLESQKRGRQELIDALGTIQRGGAPVPKEKKEKAPEISFEERTKDMGKYSWNPSKNISARE
jgi:hypothetical protein